MSWPADAVQIILVVVAAIAMVIVVRWRRRSYTKFLNDYASQEICEHLLPALELLRSRGHVVTRAGQQRSDFPLEVHLSPRFSPKEVYEALKLAEPVRLSDRGALICFEDECELKSAGR